jgi:hyperosmotically inducible protein
MLDQQSTRRGISDRLIASKVRAALAVNPITSEYQISVDTWDGIVELTGFVETATVRAEALRLARYVEGVLRVQDSLDLRRFDWTSSTENQPEGMLQGALRSVRTLPPSSSQVPMAVFCCPFSFAVDSLLSGCGLLPDELIHGFWRQGRELGRRRNHRYANERGRIGVAPMWVAKGRFFTGAALLSVR